MYNQVNVNANHNTICQRMSQNNQQQCKRNNTMSTTTTQRNNVNNKCVQLPNVTTTTRIQT